MHEDEKYLFDINGYIVVRDALSPEDVALCNEGIDRHAENDDQDATSFEQIHHRMICHSSIHKQLTYSSNIGGPFLMIGDVQMLVEVKVVEREPGQWFWQVNRVPRSTALSGCGRRRT